MDVLCKIVIRFAALHPKRDRAASFSDSGAGGEPRARRSDTLPPPAITLTWSAVFGCSTVRATGRCS
jgi:hypothetical protein